MDPEDPHAPTPAERRDAWIAVSDWCLAAAIRGKGYAAEHYGSYLEDARQAAAALEIALPELPPAGDAPHVEFTPAAGLAVETLRQGSGSELSASVEARLDAAAGAAARLAVDSHALLLWYTPTNDDVAAVAAALRAAGEASQLPAELWEPLVELLDERADFRTVRAAIFALRQKVAEHLAEQADL
jgi:hypothetical protein